ncbi:hypothetical protein DAPPUDRAFT_241940 [Daphnia pulex]|uniref:Uncharacterized protein n=1 Tax=Daphnia pulex TaxID=6669 RepID=E9GFF7_DAPPU|nr:hypothetical protein DAPPUDRAFT_241940 [Daphnia pulex]|eukprot:EFX81819.1 hypothetical protein DAPPUDRAFT_241940 [Daphnia pulex]
MECDGRSSRAEPLPTLWTVAKTSASQPVRLVLNNKDLETGAQISQQTTSTCSIVNDCRPYISLYTPYSRHDTRQNV